MPNKSSKVREKFLGLPYGTACHRLRRNLMFLLVQKTELAECYRCGSKIEEAEDLSIDHKQHWLHVSKELFWDLENIAFPHRSCNTKAQRFPQRDQKRCPKGHSWSKESTHWAKDNNKYSYRRCRACDLERWHKRKEKANRNRRIKRLWGNGLSLRQISKEVGVSHVTVKKILNGR